MLLSISGLAAYYARLTFAVILCFAMLSHASPVSAHVAHAGEVELFQGMQGPYAMRVLAVPYVGYLHVTVIFEPENNGPLPYEPVVQVAASPEGETTSVVGPFTARVEAFAASNEFSTTLDAGTEGPWTIFVDVTSSAGEASFSLPVTLEQAGGIPLSAILTGLGLLLPILWLLSGAVRDRMQRRTGKRKTNNKRGRAAQET